MRNSENIAVVLGTKQELTPMNKKKKQRPHLTTSEAKYTHDLNNVIHNNCQYSNF